MALSNKTIGRVRPELDLSRVHDVVAAEAEIRAGHLNNLSPRERAFNIENAALKRRVAQAEARLAVINMAGNGAGHRPVGNIWERFQSFEEAVLSTEKMSDEHRLKTLAGLVEDFRRFNERKAKHEAWVDREVAKTLTGAQP